MAIQKVIQNNHCQEYCGLIITNTEDYKQCMEHHDKLYRRYLEALGEPDLAQIIIDNFRWEDKL